jgi:muramoyltetrapeptide carboxypeptidase LdcA involved in peptidoglycan recycling
MGYRAVALPYSVRVIHHRRKSALLPRFQSESLQEAGLSNDIKSADHVKPNVLRAGDAVRLVSPASTPEENNVEQIATMLESNGLRVQLGRHVFDRFGYLAGRDEDRLKDLNEAINDASVRAIITTRGGKGAYRIADGLDFAALRADPKPLIGFSEITILHLAMWSNARVPGIHGACWPAEKFGERAEQSLLRHPDYGNGDDQVHAFRNYIGTDHQWTV